MIDTATAKQLLQSTDIVELEAAVVKYKEYCNGDNEEINNNVSLQFQLLKLLLLLQNRILQLQTNAKAPASEQSGTYCGMAQCWMQMGDLEKCQGQVNKSLDLDGDNVQALLLQGEVQAAQAKYENAVASTQKAIRLLTAKKMQHVELLATAYSKLAAIYEMMGDFTDAVAVLQTSIKECDSDPLCRDATVTATLHGHLGTIQEKLGHYRDAVSSLTTAVQAYHVCLGAQHPKTQEMEFLLEMASSVK